MAGGSEEKRVEVEDAVADEDSASSTSSSDSESILSAEGVKAGGSTPVPPLNGEGRRPGSQSGAAARLSTASRRRSDPMEGLSRMRTPDLRLSAEESVRESLTRARSRISIGSSLGPRHPDFEVVFDDTDNPKSWPLWYRAWVIFSVSFSTWVVVLYSTNYTAATAGMMQEFGVHSATIVTLGVTTYLLGLAAGSLILAPMSELYGRRPVYLICIVIFALLILPTALATSLGEIIGVRFVGALFGAAMVSNGPGTVVDIANEEYRALCMSLWSIAPLNGPVTGPLIGGVVFQYLGWRWDNWLALILAGASCFLLLTVKETYAPAILQKKAAQKRKETGDERWWCRYDEAKSKRELFAVNLSRPITLALTEPILWFFNVWISLIYGILYLCFVAYPIVFTQHRGWGPSTSGLAFVGIGIGTLIVIICEPLIRRMINAHPKEPATGRVTPEATASALLLGAVLTPIGQLGFSWTSLPTTIHWAAPIAFGIPFGAGNTLCFIYGANYMAGAYGIYAASALAGNAVMRSIFGGALPLVGPIMYEKLTPQWAGTLLGLLEVLLIPIPWAFYRYGDRIRAKSAVIRQMREDAARNESHASRQAQMQAQRQARQVEDEVNAENANTTEQRVELDVEKGTSPRRLDHAEQIGEKS